MVTIIIGTLGIYFLGVLFVLVSLAYLLAKNYIRKRDVDINYAFLSWIFILPLLLYIIKIAADKLFDYMYNKFK